MCEYCGCRDNAEIALLGAQHDAIVELADQVLAAVQTGDETMLGAAARLRELLVPHVEREETGVFRVAERMGLTNEYVEDLEGDHRRFDAVLSRAESLDAESLESMLDDLYRHIAVEEYDLFPVVAKELLEFDRMSSGFASALGFVDQSFVADGAQGESVTLDRGPEAIA